MAVNASCPASALQTQRQPRYTPRRPGVVSMEVAQLRTEMAGSLRLCPSQKRKPRQGSCCTVRVAVRHAGNQQASSVTSSCCAARTIARPGSMSIRHHQCRASRPLKRGLCALVTTVLRRGCKLARLESSLSHSAHALLVSMAPLLAAICLSTSCRSSNAVQRRVRLRKSYPVRRRSSALLHRAEHAPAHRIAACVLRACVEVRCRAARCAEHIVHASS